MAAAKKICASCENGFIARAGALYCSPTCRKRGNRARGDDKCDTVTVTRTRTGAPGGRRGTAGAPHCPEAVALLKRWDAELAENSKHLGKPLKWSAAESAILELAADTIDRRAELRELYESTGDNKLRLKVAGELRLIEAALARLLAKIKTDLPAPQSTRSRKAEHAARVRWDSAAN
jgi:hypothetical protein